MSKGFTVVEFLILVGIIFVLAAVVIPNIINPPEPIKKESVRVQSFQVTEDLLSPRTFTLVYCDGSVEDRVDIEASQIIVGCK